MVGHVEKIEVAGTTEMLVIYEAFCRRNVGRTKKKWCG
jgi:hypothetical protein